MERPLKDEIKSRFATNIVQSRKFSELLVDSLAKYRNRAIETAQVIEELIAMAKQFNEAARRGEEVNLNVSLRPRTCSAPASNTSALHTSR